MLSCEFSGWLLALSWITKFPEALGPGVTVVI